MLQATEPVMTAQQEVAEVDTVEEETI